MGHRGAAGGGAIGCGWWSLGGNVVTKKGVIGGAENDAAVAEGRCVTGKTLRCDVCPYQIRTKFEDIWYEVPLTTSCGMVPSWLIQKQAAALLGTRTEPRKNTS